MKDDEINKSNKIKENNNDKQNIVINLNKNDDDVENTDKNKKTAMNKAFFRELFDGVDEQYGRIIVMDTNNPEKLDPIMIRNGRIDIKIRFDKMSSDNMKKYLNYVFDTNISDDIILPDRVFRVSNIQSIVESCLNNERSIFECIDEIKNNKIDELFN